MVRKSGAVMLCYSTAAYLIAAGWQVLVDALSPAGRRLAGEQDAPRPLAKNIAVNWEDCIGCRECAKACPVNCITIVTRAATPREDLGITSDGRSKTEWVLEFDIDMSKCLLCGMCVNPCPTGCLVLDSSPVGAFRERDLAVFHYTPFTPEKAFQIKNTDNMRRLL